MTAVETRPAAAAAAMEGHGLERRVQAIRLVTILLLIVAWEALSYSGLFYKGVLPSTVLIVPAVIDLLTDPTFYRHLAVSLGEILAGLGIAAALAIPLGILFGARRFLGRVVAPYVTALATTPKIVFLPIVMLAFGIGPESKTALGALSAFFPIVLSTTAGVVHVSPVHLNVGRSFNLSTWQMVRKIYLPSLVQPILTGLRLGLGVAIIGVLLGEIKLSNAGLGFHAGDFYSQYRIPHLYAVLILIFTLAVAANTAMGLIARKVGSQAPDAPH
jgi:ABC-type nitrate/sulfonate/bicarbonate transport system permease component